MSKKTFPQCGEFSTIQDKVLAYKERGKNKVS